MCQAYSLGERPPRTLCGRKSLLSSRQDSIASRLLQGQEPRLVQALFAEPALKLSTNALSTGLPGRM